MRLLSQLETEQRGIQMIERSKHGTPKEAVGDCFRCSNIVMKSLKFSELTFIPTSTTFLGTMYIFPNSKLPIIHGE